MAIREVTARYIADLAEDLNRKRPSPVAIGGILAEKLKLKWVKARVVRSYIIPEKLEEHFRSDGLADAPVARRGKR